LDNESNPDTIDEDDDEHISDYIDMILFAIVTNMERHKAYLLNTTTSLLDEIYEHSASIANAESSLNIHVRRIIQNFKATIHYDASMSRSDVDTFTTAHAAFEQVEIDKANDKANESTSNDFNDLQNGQVEIDKANESTSNDLNDLQNGQVEIDHANASTSNDLNDLQNEQVEIDKANKSTSNDLHELQNGQVEIDEANESTSNDLNDLQNGQVEIDNANESTSNDLNDLQNGQVEIKRIRRPRCRSAHGNGRLR
jgi:chromosome segregation ATPase